MHHMLLCMIYHTVHLGSWPSMPIKWPSFTSQWWNTDSARLVTSWNMIYTTRSKIYALYNPAFIRRLQISCLNFACWLCCVMQMSPPRCFWEFFLKNSRTSWDKVRKYNVYLDEISKWKIRHSNTWLWPSCVLTGVGGWPDLNIGCQPDYYFMTMYAYLKCYFLHWKYP